MSYQSDQCSTYWFNSIPTTNTKMLWHTCSNLEPHPTRLIRRYYMNSSVLYKYLRSTQCTADVVPNTHPHMSDIFTVQILASLLAKGTNHGSSPRYRTHTSTMIYYNIAKQYGTRWQGISSINTIQDYIRFGTGTIRYKGIIWYQPEWQDLVQIQLQVPQTQSMVSPKRLVLQYHLDPWVMDQFQFDTI